MARISIVTQWYPPEQAPFGTMMEELASFLAARGWQVTVITGFPNHPSGTVHAGYSKRWLSDEHV
ncbi:MAG: glycosyltransferase family 4 protein, partial [Steroidobacteraceae bacterium]